MPDLKISQPYPGAWIGYCLLWNQYFPRSAHYDLMKLIGQQLDGVGEIIQAKKDTQGVFVMVRTNRIAENYEWEYTAGEPVYQFELNKTTGETDKVLKSYPILTLGYKSSEVQYALPANPVVVTKRTKRNGRTVPETQSND